MMKNIAKYIRLNGTYLALTSDNVLVGYLQEVKPVARPPERVIDEFK